VAQSLLQIGEGFDGIGRIVIRGKTCEIKAATPKGEGFFDGKKIHSLRRGNGNGHLRYRQRPEQYSQPAHQQFNNHVNPAFAYMGYPMTPNVQSGPMVNIHSSHYHPGYHHSGLDGYGATMYYHGIPLYPQMPVAPTLTAAPHCYISPYIPVMSGASSHVQPTVVLEPYSLSSPTCSHEHDVAIAPNATFSAAGMESHAAVTHVSAKNICTSVMQPVAPRIPGKGTDSPELS
jgi:hypothetical protein